MIVGGDGYASHDDCDPDDAVADLSNGDPGRCWICGEDIDDTPDRATGANRESEEPMSTNREVFVPVVGVTGGDTIDIDWSSSYASTHREDGSEIEDPVERGENDDAMTPGALLLDQLVLGKTPAEALRAIADHIDGQNGVPRNAHTEGYAVTYSWDADDSASDAVVGRNAEIAGVDYSMEGVGHEDDEPVWIVRRLDEDDEPIGDEIKVPVDGNGPVYIY